MSKSKTEEDELVTGKSPVRYILALFLILLLVLMIFPYYSVKLDPEPRGIPGIDEVVPDNMQRDNITSGDFLELLSPNDPDIKLIADRIATYGCDSNRICHAKALFYFVRDNFDYVSDPASFEYIKSAKESLLSHGGDCDDASVLLANLLQAIGIRTRFVFVPGHVFVQANIPEAINRYKVKEEDWVNLDATCKTCKFGELSYSTTKQKKIYLPQI